MSDQGQLEHRRRIIIAAVVTLVGLMALHSHHRGRFAPVMLGADSRQHSADSRQHVGQEQFGDRWIVFTSISYPTEAVKKLASLEGWKVVMVADRKTPADWHHENITFLSIEEQQQLPYQIIQHLPWDNYGRKNIGYLYAIHHGAKVIYETDDDNELIVPTILQLAPGSVGQSELTSNVTGEPILGEYTMLDVPDDSKVNFNPYPLFGVAEMWLRGLPLQSIKDNQPNCFKRVQGKPLVQQGLANNDPDVDAIYRLTLPLGVKFDSNAFSVLLPRNVVTPFNSQNTLFLHDALWALLLPVTTTMRVCDIWRGFWAQRLLWDVGGHLAFIPPTVVQHRNPHTMFKDFQQELPLYNMAGALVEDLRTWVPKANNLPERMVELAQLMSLKGYWETGDVRLMQAWVADLTAVGYKFPSVTAVQEAAVHRNTAAPAAAEGPNMAGNWQPNTFTFPRRWCRQQDMFLTVNLNKVETFHAEVVRFLYAAYKPWFKEVYFTGEASAGAEPIHHNFIHCQSSNEYTLEARPGHFAQVCLAEVIRHVQNLGDGFRITGFFYINDDVTFSPCMLSQLNSSRVWYDSPFVLSFDQAQQHQAQLKDASLRLDVSDVESNNVWWFKTDWSNGQMPGVLRNHFHKALASAYGWMAEQVKQRLDDPEHTGQHMFGIGQGDFFYVPARFAHAYTRWADHMREYYVFSEVAIPNILGLLGDGPGDYELVPAATLWGRASRKAAVNNLNNVLPLHNSMDLSASCGAMIPNKVGMLWQKPNSPCGRSMHSRRKLLATAAAAAAPGSNLSNFLIHPIKLSDSDVRQHWTNWWQSQQCR